MPHLENLDLRAAQLAQVRRARAAGLPWVNLLGPNWLKRMLADTRAPKPRNLPRWF